VGRSHSENLVYDLFPTVKRPKLCFPGYPQDRKSLKPQDPHASSIDDNFRLFLADVVTHFSKNVQGVSTYEVNMSSFFRVLRWFMKRSRDYSYFNVILGSYDDLCKRQIRNDFNFASCVQVLLVFESGHPPTPPTHKPYRTSESVHAGSHEDEMIGEDLLMMSFWFAARK
jgi:hypothetical protein